MKIIFQKRNNYKKKYNMLFEIIFRIMPTSDDNYVLKKILKHCSKLIFKIILNLI